MQREFFDDLDALFGDYSVCSWEPEGYDWYEAELEGMWFDLLDEEDGSGDAVVNALQYA